MISVDPLSVFANSGLSAPRLILRADFSNCTIGAPTFVSAKNYNQTITFGDMNATAMNEFFDSGYLLRLQNIIDRDAVGADNAARVADFTSVLENSIISVPGPFGGNVSVLYQNLKNRSQPPNTVSIINQTWLNILRNAPGSSPASNINTIYVSYWRKSQVAGALPLDQFLDYTHPSTQGFWRSEFEIKSGGYGGAEGGGDYKIALRTDEDASGLFWLMRGDTRAANDPVPGVPSTPATLWNAVSVTPSVESNAWYKVEIFIQRHNAINRTYAAITMASTGVCTVICDVSVSGDLFGVGDAQEGLYRLPWSQMFLAGLYADGIPANYPLNSYLYDLQVWANAPEDNILATKSRQAEVLANHIKIAPITGVGHEINGVLASAEALAVYRQPFTAGGALLAAEAGDVLADTGFPVIASITETIFATDATAHLVSMPATVNVGDGLIVLLTTDGSATVTTPVGWKRLYTEDNSAACRGGAYARVGRGTEGGTTVDFVTSAIENAAAQVYRITNWNGTLAGLQAGTVGEITAGTTADPAAVTAYWGSAKTRWLATCHTSTSQTVSTAPTNYTDLTQTTSGAVTTGAQCISARRSLETETEDPGVFTMSGTGASKVYNTIAIAPAYVGMKYERFNITNGTTLWAGIYTSQPHTVADTGVTRAVIVCHGSGLDAAEYSNVVRKTLRDYLGKVIVIAPFFAESESGPESGQLFWGNSWPELGKSDASLAWRISSGGVLDNLIAQLYTTFINLQGVVLAGHSAGGQLCNRYSAASSDSRNRYLVSAASSYLYPGTERPNGGGWIIPITPTTYNDYKYGLAVLSTIEYVNLIGAATLRTRLRAAKVHYLVGANDNDPADTGMDLTADASTQGAHRVERQQLYHNHLPYYWR